MDQTIVYIASHYTDIISAIGGLVIAARIIVKLTPSPTDDSVLETVVGFLKHIGLHIDSSK